MAQRGEGDSVYCVEAIVDRLGFTCSEAELTDQSSGYREKVHDFVKFPGALELEGTRQCTRSN
jgi:hypothetical protein